MDDRPPEQPLPEQVGQYRRGHCPEHVGDGEVLPEAPDQLSQNGGAYLLEGVGLGFEGETELELVAGHVDGQELGASA